MSSKPPFTGAITVRHHHRLKTSPSPNLASPPRIPPLLASSSQAAPLLGNAVSRPRFPPLSTAFTAPPAVPLAVHEPTTAPAPAPRTTLPAPAP